MSGYTQLTQEERHQIHLLKRAGHAQSEMAEVLGRHKATISRELQRNTGLSGYRPKQAHRLALTRRKAWRGGRFKGPHWAANSCVAASRLESRAGRPSTIARSDSRYAASISGFICAKKFITPRTFQISETAPTAQKLQ